MDYKRGDLIRVDWVDIAEDPGGDPDSAALVERTSYGLFWAKKEDRGIPVLVTTTTLDKVHNGQNGWCIYPVSCVRKTSLIKKAPAARGGRRSKLQQSPPDTPQDTPEKA